MIRKKGDWWENATIRRIGLKRTFQELLFKTEDSEFTDWICRKKEKTVPEIMLWFPAQVAGQMKYL